ncbi:phosphomevalonate kinase [Streptomyces sp. Act143]|uniref:phosphomevalonate kinase n=1 Tax=Streptomyces sp. Act143 TaxID=2200760 RepID=UPI000D679F07|nr:phosphomevalonate kinase [Streptomyces sp. Act143]PWI19580.1 phosphomevalonate kinase [Streptomyces sp. Act143]
MAGQRTVVRRAPGKLFVAGEYAVVEPGNQAILVAVDRYITVTVSECEVAGADVVVDSDLGARPALLRRHGGRLAGGDGRTPHVVSALDTVAELLAEHGLPVPPLSVSISSTLHADGRKYGLGSSGAVTVATVDAVTSYCGLRLTREERFRLAMLAGARLEPKGSGGDLAAATWGGWIAYRAPDRTQVLDLARAHGVAESLRAPWPGFSVRRLPAPAGLSFQVGWTGSPASTEALVSGLHGRRTWRGSASHQKFVATTADFVQAAVAALDSGDGPALLHEIRRARQELARLDDEVGLGIFTPALTALCDAAEAVGGAAKPSGAGGGDCGIALLDERAAHDISQVRQRWAAAGVLPLPLRPALEGNEA